MERSRLSEQLEHYMQRMAQEFGQQLSQQQERNKEWTSEQLEKLETKLLTAFDAWSEPTTVRIRSHSAEIRALQVGLESLQDRVKNLEDNRP